MHVVRQAVDEIKAQAMFWELNELPVTQNLELELRSWALCYAELAQQVQVESDHALAAGIEMPELMIRMDASDFQLPSSNVCLICLERFAMEEKTGQNYKKQAKIGVI